MHKQTLAPGGVLLPELDGVFASRIHIAIHEVVNHFDLVANVEFAQRAFLQILRDRSHAIALLDREARNRKIRTVKSHQSDVGSVERGHKWELAAAGFG